MPREKKTTPKKRQASKKKAAANKKPARRPTLWDREQAEKAKAEEERKLAASQGGLQMPVCVNCGRQILPDESFEILPGEEHHRVHRPLCIAETSYLEKNKV